MALYNLHPAVGVDRERIRDFIVETLGDEVAFAARTADPFLVDHDCLNISGHHFIGSCGDVVCSHCGRIAWA